jgi:hypothetical protein
MKIQTEDDASDDVWDVGVEVEWETMSRKRILMLASMSAPAVY